MSAVTFAPGRSASPAPAVSFFTFAPTDAIGMTVRAIKRDGDPWFVAKDVCDALGYANASDALADHVEAEDKHSVSIGLPGRAPIIINESGLYSLIMRSTKPEAKAFKRWVMKDVLPTIRKQGAYVQGAERLSPEAQDALYASIRGLVAEAMRRYDWETEHAHWRALHRQRDWFRLAAKKVSREMSLPLDVVISAGSHGVDAGMAILVRAAP